MPVARRVGSNSGHRARPRARLAKKAAHARVGNVTEEDKVEEQSIRTKRVNKRVNRPSKAAKVQTTKKAAKPQKRKKADKAQTTDKVAKPQKRKDTSKTSERQAKKARVLPVKRRTVTHVSHPKVCGTSIQMCRLRK